MNRNLAFPKNKAKDGKPSARKASETAFSRFGDLEIWKQVNRNLAFPTSKSNDSKPSARKTSETPFSRFGDWEIERFGNK